MKHLAVIALSGLGSVVQAAPAPVVTNAPEAGALQARDAPALKNAGDWTSIKCDASGLTDAAIPAETRWAAAKAQDAWDDILKQWDTDKGSSKLTFAPYVYNLFHQNDGQRCESVASNECSSVTCDADKGTPPAGMLILNSFSKIHDYLAEVKEGFQDVGIEGAFGIAGFTQKFIKVERSLSDNIALQNILNAVEMATGFGGALVWNAVIKMAAKPALKAGLQGATDTAIGSSFAAAANNKPMADNVLGLVTQLSDAAGKMYANIAKGQEDFLAQLFDAKDEQSIKTLTGMVSEGGMNELDLKQLNKFSDIKNDLKSLFYGSILWQAWKASPDKQTPVILRATKDFYRCGAKLDTSGDLGLQYLMTDDTAKKTSWCDEQGDSWFLVNAMQDDVRDLAKCQARPTDRKLCNTDHQPFEPLAGGTDADLNAYGLSIEKIVRSSYGGFVAFNNQNGYQLEKDNDSASMIVGPDWKPNKGENKFVAGIETPGFFSFPICLNPKQARKNMVDNKDICSKDGDANSDIKAEPKEEKKNNQCKLRVKHWRWNPNKRDENHIENGYQIAAYVYDDAGRELGSALKQSAHEAISFKANELPSPVIVQSLGDNDAGDSVCMWYRDQWWCQNDAAHGCKFDHFSKDGYREGECGFDCSLDKDQSPDFAAPSRPAPGAIDGANPPVLVPSQEFAGGQCRVHVRQYQRVQGDFSENPTQGYRVEVSLWDGADKDDGKRHHVAYSSDIDSPEARAVKIRGAMPMDMEVTSNPPENTSQSAVKEDKNVLGDKNWILFSYNGKGFTSRQGKDAKKKKGENGCQEGGWDNGHRDVDCYFEC